jgi:hypothetical protein
VGGNKREIEIYCRCGVCHQLNSHNAPTVAVAKGVIARMARHDIQQKSSGSFSNPRNIGSFRKDELIKGGNSNG